MCLPMFRSSRHSVWLVGLSLLRVANAEKEEGCVPWWHQLSFVVPPPSWAFQLQWQHHHLVAFVSLRSYATTKSKDEELSSSVRLLCFLRAH